MEEIIIKEYKDLQSLIHKMLDEIEGFSVKGQPKFILDSSQEEKLKFFNDLIDRPKLFTPDIKKTKLLIEESLKKKSIEEIIVPTDYHYVGPHSTKLKITI